MFAGVRAHGCESWQMSECALLQVDWSTDLCLCQVRSFGRLDCAITCLEQIIRPLIHIQNLAMAELLGADGSSGDLTFEVCGSPGEVANDPWYGQPFALYIADNDVYPYKDGLNVDYNMLHGKAMVQNTIAVFGRDQLRQRTAWALSQILVVGQDGGLDQKQRRISDINAVSNFCQCDKFHTSLIICKVENCTHV